MFSSSIGRKILMAVTGLLMVGFILAHLLGNLQIFLGQDQFNDYAKFLHSIPEILWPARLVLLACVLVHIAVAFSLRSTNKTARPTGYQAERTLQASTASLYMLETGLVILFFIIIHLLHFTFGALQPEFSGMHDNAGRLDVYSMVIHGFQNITYSGLYILCMLGVGVHLSHALGSLFATLGIGKPEFRERAMELGKVAAMGIALAYISIPVSVMVGLLRLP